VVGVALGLGQIFASDVDFEIKILAAMQIIALVNLALFVFNMIPLLPLDGGHIAGALWGAVKNGWARVRNLPRPAPVDLARMMPVAYGVFALLIGLGAVLIVADVVAPVSFL
jgi:membrane-associated protease RseP (regulator of RpoE activity)